MANEFKPNWRSPPGDTIKDLMEEQNLTLQYVASKLKVSDGFMLRLLEGREVLDSRIAEDLNRLFSVPAKFWLEREKRWRAGG